MVVLSVWNCGITWFFYNVFKLLIRLETLYNFPGRLNFMKYSKYRWKYISVFILFVTFLCFFQESVYALDTKEKSVLILSSNSNASTIVSGVETKEWTDEIRASISSQFVNSKENIDVNVQYMGGGEKNWPQYYKLYKSNFSDTKFDVVICIGDSTFNFLLKYGDKLFHNTPVVFCGIHNLSKSILKEHPLFTGIIKSNDVQNTLDEALRLHPGTKQIFLINEDMEKSKALISLYKDKVNIIATNESDMVKLKKKINSLPKNTIIYFGKKSINNNGEAVPLQKLSYFLFSDVNIPVYSVSIRYLKLCKEDVGGVVTYGNDLGEEIGKIALRILAGEKPSNIPVVEDSLHKYAFNYEQLKRFNIALDLLPKGSQIINAPQNTYAISRKLILCFSIAALLIIMGGAIFISTNVYKRKKAEKLLSESNNLLSALKYYDNLKSNFFSNISHELRTPLNLIYSALQVLELRASLDKEKYNKERKYLGIMRQNCYRLLRIISNLIDISKIDAGYFYTNLQNRDIVNIVESIVLSTVQYVESKDISITFDTDVEEKIMAFDLEAMERIVLNLISNSIKFTPSGGSIEVSISEKVDSIIICVKDTGVGIPLEKQTSIFEKFVQVDKSLSRSKEGSGIGLSLVKELVSMHGGTINVESTLGKGSKFIIELPVKLLSAEESSDEKDIYTNGGKVERIKVEFSDIYN